MPIMESTSPLLEPLLDPRSARCLSLGDVGLEEVLLRLPKLRYKPYFLLPLPLELDA